MLAAQQYRDQGWEGVTEGGAQGAGPLPPQGLVGKCATNVLADSSTGKERRQVISLCSSRSLASSAPSPWVSVAMHECSGEV